MRQVGWWVSELVEWNWVKSSWVDIRETEYSPYSRCDS